MNRLFFLALVLIISTSCESERIDGGASTHSQKAERTTPPPTIAKRYGYEVVKRIPHDANSFTQGLTVHNGAFVESTGQTGFSSVRRVNMTTGKVMQTLGLDARYFGEGSTVVGNKLYVITWLHQVGLMFDAATFKALGEFHYAGEGWGLTTDGTVLYMSNGTNMIAVRDAEEMQILRSFSVKLDGSLLRDLNELEWIEGELWANVWKTDLIVRINPNSGEVVGVVDLAGILPERERPPTADVLNGIAYDARTKAIYVTGKNWPWIYQIEIR